MAAASIYQLYMRRKEGTENKHQLIFPLYLLSIFVYLLYPLLSISNIYQSPTQACAHTSLSHCLLCFCLFNFSPPLRYLSLPACVQHVLLWSVQHTAVSWVWATAPQESRTASQGEDTTNLPAHIQIVRYKELDSHMKVYFSLDKQFATLFFGLFLFLLTMLGVWWDLTQLHFTQNLSCTFNLFNFPF